MVRGLPKRRALWQVRYVTAQASNPSQKSIDSPGRRNSMDFLLVDSSLKDWAPKGVVNGSTRLPTVSTYLAPLLERVQLFAPRLLTTGSARWSWLKSDMTAELAKLAKLAELAECMAWSLFPYRTMTIVTV
jgi:hypothetical protein